MTSSAKWFLLALVAFLGALSLVAAAPAADDVLVSNLGETKGGVIRSANESNAIGFTTGSDSAGYFLTSIEVRTPNALNATQRNTVRTQLWSKATSGGPGSKITDLTVPPNVAAGVVSLAAPQNTTLAADTTYFFVAYTTDNTQFRLDVTFSANEDTSQTGWSIKNASWFQSNNVPTGSWTKDTGNSSPIQIRVNGAAVPSLSVEARPSCGSTVTDMSVQPRYALTLTPAPTAATRVEARPVAADERGWRSSVLSIGSSGRSGETTRNPFSQLRNVYPGFKGFEFRLANDHSVMAKKCLWRFSEQTPRDNDRTFNPAPPPSGPTGGDPSPGGGGSPPTVPSDPTPDSPRCGTDREDLKRFYEMTGGEGWNRGEYWNSREPLGEWHGVETEDGSVVSLRLPDNNLSGDMPTTELLCLEDKELVELALWGNDDLEGEVPPELVLAVERAALRDIAETLNINPGWFENYEDPYDFEAWHAGITTDDEGRVTGLDLTGEGVIGELPESVSQLRRLGEIMVTRSSGGCALSPEDSSAFSLFLLTLLVFAVLGRKRARD